MATPANVSSFAGNATAKKVSITNSAGEVLVGVLNDTGSKELVILSHGFPGTKEFFTLIHVASALGESGVSSFRFDFSGSGESEGQREFANDWKEVEDIHSVVEYWIGQGRIVKAIVGHSQGGVVVLLYASKYRDVSTVVNLSGACDRKEALLNLMDESFLQNIEEKGYFDVKDESGNTKFRVTKEGWKRLLDVDMKLVAQSIPNDCRVFTVHGSADNLLPVENAFQFDKLIPNHKLSIIDGADHLYTDHQAEVAAVVVEILN